MLAKLASLTSVFTYKYKLRPTPAQRQLLRSYMGAYRYTYNQMVSMYNDSDRCQAIFGVKQPPSTQDAREHIMQRVNATDELSWVKDVPYNLRELAPREYAKAVKVSRVSSCTSSRSRKTVGYSVRILESRRSEALPTAKQGALSVERTVNMQGPASVACYTEFTEWCTPSHGM